MAEGGPPRWFLDANVLYARLIRGVLLEVAARGLIRPFWSERVLAEWRIAAARDGGMAAEAETRAQSAAMAARFPGALAVADPETEAALTLPDPADIHVAAAAHAARAGTIITLNLRDFPARRLAALGLVARHPDSALWELRSQDPHAIDPAIGAALAALGEEPGRTPRQRLRKGGLPRLGKALDLSS